MNLQEYYKNKVLLITGASMGIGKEIAIQALGYGGKVVMTARNAQKLQSVTDELKEHSENILIHAGSVASYDDNIRLVEKTILRFGRLDILISNAGMSAFGNLEITNPRVVDEIIDTNIKGSVFTYLAAISELKKTRGSIIFISSIAGLQGLPSYSLYSLSKMSLTALSQSIAIENKKLGVFTGISYVGFTENESSKRTLSPDGNLERIQPRNKLVVKSREKTAKIILKQIAKNRSVVVHSFIGKFLYFLSRYTPGIVKLVYTKNYYNDL